MSAACGIQLDARGYAAAGLAVTAIDLSPVAIDYARAFTSFESRRKRFVRDADLREGGSLDYRVGSLLDASVCPGPFDFVYCSKTLQYQNRAGRLVPALEALVARMAPDGMLAMTTHNDYGLDPPLRAWLEANGFRLWYRADEPGFFESTPGRRRALHFMSSG